MRAKKSLIFAVCILSVSLMFTGCKLVINTDADEVIEETSEKETKKQVSDKKSKKLKSTAVNDGNLVGNMVCYGRMVNNKDSYYFRNPKDQERIYSVDMSGNVRRISGDIFMKDMHILNGNIYYANTNIGDQKDINFTDHNLYRYSINTGENTKLTNLDFGVGDDSWLSFESLVDNYCYFSYSNGQDGIYHICRVDISGQNFAELFTIPSGQNVGNPNVSVVDKRYVYFLTKEGFNCYDMESKQNTVVIPGFDCQNYIIYNGTLYYTETDPYLRSSDLAGKNQKIVYDGSGLDFKADSVQFNIYENTLYVLEKSYSQRMGSLKKMEIDGSNVVDIAEDINWFNIVNGNVFLRYWDGKSRPDTELYTYNIAANTPIGQVVNFDAAVSNAKPEISTPVTQNAQSVGSEKDDDYYERMYAPVINEYRSEILANNADNSAVKGPESSDRYGFYDINGNGIKEMVITSEYFTSCLYLYTLHNGSPELTGTYDTWRMGRDIMEGGCIYEYIYERGKDSYNIYELDDSDNLVAISLVSKEHKFLENGMETYIYMINNMEVSRTDFDNFCLKYGIDENTGISSKSITGKYPGTRSF